MSTATPNGLLVKPHPPATTNKELQALYRYWSDLEALRAKLYENLLPLASGLKQWTPTDGSGAGLTLTFTAANCTYRKHGKIVVLQGEITYPVTANVSVATIGGFPYAAAGKHTCHVYSSGAGNPCGGRLVASLMDISTTGAGSITNANMSGASLTFSISYLT